MPERQQITASPGDVRRHIDRLMRVPLPELAEDVGRDPSNSNVALVRLVLDVRLGEQQRQLTRYSLVLAAATVLLAAATVALVFVTR